MLNMLRGFPAMTVFLFCLIILAGCSKGEETIRIGVAGPMTGPDAKMGADMRNGVSLAAEEWNGRGGLFGKKIVVVADDDQSDPKQAVAVANKLVNEGVTGVIGHFNSSCSIPASDVYNRAGIPMITPASTNPLLTGRGYKGIFRVCGTDDQQGRVAADFVRTRLRAKRVAVIHDKTTYGQGLADFFRSHIGGYAEIVYYGGITRGDKDFKTVLTSVKQASPDLLYFGGIYADAGLIVKQAREISFTTPLMSGDGVIDTKFVEIAGEKAAEGTFLTFGPSPRENGQAGDVIKKYREKFGEPGPYSLYAYDAAQVLLTALKAASVPDGRAVADKIHSMEFPGSHGIIRFASNGDVAHAPYVVWITRSGKFEEHWKP